jgi:hypothetical protein
MSIVFVRRRRCCDCWLVEFALLTVVSLVRRRLYERAVHRFGATDVSLWVQFVQFCIDVKSFSKVGTVFSRFVPRLCKAFLVVAEQYNRYRALQAHPDNAALWIQCASHEFTHNSNVDGARGECFLAFD